MINEKFLYSKEVEIGIAPTEVAMQFANGTSGQQATFLDAVAATWDQWKESASDSQIEFMVSGLSDRARNMIHRIHAFVVERERVREEANLDD